MCAGRSSKQFLVEVLNARDRELVEPISSFDLPFGPRACDVSASGYGHGRYRRGTEWSIDSSTPLHSVGFGSLVLCGTGFTSRFIHSLRETKLGKHQCC